MMFLTVIIFIGVAIAFMSVSKPSLSAPDSLRELRVFIDLKGGDLYPTAGMTWSFFAYPRATFYNAVLGQLFYVDMAGQLSAGLVEFWQSEQNSTVWTLRLRKEIKFHDGREATSEDLRFSFLRYLRSPIKTPEGELLGRLNVIQLIDNSTIRIHLKTPDPFFIQNHALSELSLVPAEHLMPDLLTWKTHPIGAGPYKVISVGAGFVVVEKTESPLISNPDAPRLIRFVADPNEKVDLVIGFNPNTEKMNLKQISLDLPKSIQTLMFNYSTTLANDHSFRRAINVALDRVFLAQVAGDGATPNDTLIPSDFEVDRDKLLAADPDEAKKLFSMVRGFTWKIAIPIFHNNTVTPWLEELANQLGRSGVVVNFESINSTPISGKFPIEIHGIVPDVGDPTVLYSQFGDGAPYGPGASVLPST